MKKLIDYFFALVGGTFLLAVVAAIIKRGVTEDPTNFVVLFLLIAAVIHSFHLQEKT